MRNKLKIFLSAVVAILVTTIGCQKLDKPGLGDYPVDNNPPDGPLKFYAAFDGTGSNQLLNAVDSIKALFPSDNPFTTAEGVMGKAITGVNKKYIKYPSFNSWVASSSITISVWIKKNGQTKNNADKNGPEYILSLKAADNYHWSNAVMFLFLEGNNSACAIKSMVVSPSDPTKPNSSATDSWFAWEGGQMIAGLLDDKWHHLALSYDETNSSVKLYVDGVQNPNVKTWSAHGPLRLSTTKITEYRVGAGPSNQFDSDDWLAATFKGSLDQLRLYGKALSAPEIQTLYNKKL